MAEPEGKSIPQSHHAETLELPPALRTYPRTLVCGPEVGVHWALHEPNYFPAHVHPAIQILVTSDSALCDVSWTDGRGQIIQRRIGPNQIWTMPAGFSHTAHWRRRAKAIVLFADPAWATELCGSAIETAAILPMDHYVLADPLIGGLKLEFDDDSSWNLPVNLPRMRMLGGCLAAQILIAHSAGLRRDIEGSTLLHPDVKARVASFIAANLGAELSVSILAREARLSPSHFSALFKATTGLTPEQFVLRSRLLKARELVQTGEYTIGQIAYATGFSDHSHLTVQFKRRFGVPPKAYLPAIRHV
jgi:AraC family transcriptional regulator